MSRHFEKAEGLFEHPDEVTHEYLFNQTMLRIKDPKPSLDPSEPSKNASL